MSANTLIDQGNPGGAGSAGSGISASGEVARRSYLNTVPFFTRGPGTPGGGQSAAYAVNGNGRVAARGSSFPGQEHAFLLTPGWRRAPRTCCLPTRFTPEAAGGHAEPATGSPVSPLASRLPPAH